MFFLAGSYGHPVVLADKTDSDESSLMFRNHDIFKLECSLMGIKKGRTLADAPQNNLPFRTCQTVARLAVRLLFIRLALYQSSKLAYSSRSSLSSKVGMNAVCIGLTGMLQLSR